MGFQLDFHGGSEPGEAGSSAAEQQGLHLLPLGDRGLESLPSASGMRKQGSEAFSDPFEVYGLRQEYSAVEFRSVLGHFLELRGGFNKALKLYLESTGCARWRPAP